MSGSATRVITAHIPADMVEKIDALAEQSDRSRGWIVRQALASLLAEEEQRHALIQAALSSVDNGHVVKHADVKLWADSLATRNPLPLPRSGKE